MKEYIAIARLLAVYALVYVVVYYTLGVDDETRMIKAVSFSTLVVGFTYSMQGLFGPLKPVIRQITYITIIHFLWVLAVMLLGSRDGSILDTLLISFLGFSAPAFGIIILVAERIFKKFIEY